MVVDDNASIREIIARALREEGYTVVTARDGFDALNKTAKRTFDLVFLDISLPGQSGLDVLSKLNSIHPLTPVIILTAVQDVAYEKVAMRRQAVAYLRKPCGVGEITEMANRMLSRRRGRKMKETVALKNKR